MIDLSARERDSDASRELNKQESVTRSSLRSSAPMPKTLHKLRKSQLSTPQSRDSEWLLAAVMCGWAIMLAMPGNSLVGPAFSAFHRFAWSTETFWAAIFGSVGSLRAVSLYINGASPRTPYGRMVGAAVGFVLWMVLVVLIAEGSVEQLGKLPPGIATYAVFIAAEARSLWRASYDARYSSAN